MCDLHDKEIGNDKVTPLELDNDLSFDTAMQR